MTFGQFIRQGKIVSWLEQAKDHRRENVLAKDSRRLYVPSLTQVLLFSDVGSDMLPSSCTLLWRIV
jgi:hypothetical protein